MSARGGGGRGGGRGGRGGGPRRPPGDPGSNWDTGEEVESQPADLFPKYAVPTASPLTATETRQINLFLLFRRQIHDGPLYTTPRQRSHASSSTSSAAAEAVALRTTKAYGREQMNMRYAVHSKATVDPFTAVPTYSERFVREPRTFPDFSTRDYCKELFPPELQSTIEVEDLPPGQSARRTTRKRLQLSRITALTTAEDLLRHISPANGAEEDDAHDPEAARRLALSRIADAGGDDDGAMDEDEMAEDDEDMVFEDEDDGDYNAEVYFDGGDGDDYGDDDGGDEAIY